jgi:hypothetical protein
MAAVRVAQRGVDPEKDHDPQWLACGIEQATDFLGGEQLRPPLRLMQAEDVLARPGEAGAKPHRPFNEAVVEGEFEHAADVLDGDPKPGRPPGHGRLAAQGSEVIGAEVRHQPALAELAHHQRAHLAVLCPRPRRQLPRVYHPLLAIEEEVGHILDR